MRKKTREISVKDLKIGNNHDILVQSMCNTPTSDIDATVNQVNRLADYGCEIIRVSVPDMPSALALKSIKAHISIPLVADIHFDYKLALEAVKYADKLRINPGNIGGEEKVRKVVDAVKEQNIPIRIGVNLGSLEKDLEKEFGLTAEAMIRSAEKHIRILESYDFQNIVVSLKSSDVKKMIEANKIFAEKYDYPLHLGVTEAGGLQAGSVKNAVGIGVLLDSGIGDTIRVSISGDPVNEVITGWQILKALKIRNRGIDIISCPTCARAEINVAGIIQELEERTKGMKKNLKIAVMGCVVNGPGEAREADIGVVGIRNSFQFFLHGEKKEVIAGDNIVAHIMNCIERI